MGSSADDVDEMLRLVEISSARPRSGPSRNLGLARFGKVIQSVRVRSAFTRDATSSVIRFQVAGLRPASKKVDASFA
jgi:hypothetical protein